VGMAKTVGELRNALSGFPDDMFVTVEDPRESTGEMWGTEEIHVDAKWHGLDILVLRRSNDGSE